MARLYANENFPLPAVLAFATGENRAVVTLNRKHFIPLHAERPDHAGVIVCTFDLDVVGQAARIHGAVLAGETLVGRLLRISRPA